MPEKRNEPAFTVTDRRKFTSEGEPREEGESREQSSAAPPPVSTETAAAPAPTQPEAAQTPQEPPLPPPPSAAEQKAGHDAYRQAGATLDAEMARRGQRQDVQMTFEVFLWNLYMTGLYQLGALPDEGGQQPTRRTVDPLGARLTIDTLTLLEEKTKGNLTDKERETLQRFLFELRMAFLDVMNALARQAKDTAARPEIK
jgi:hypothetical protein